MIRHEAAAHPQAGVLKELSCRVSVLMPTFEQPQFIRRALHSLQAQTLRNWELIIIDDGSDGDATRLAVQPWLADRRIRYQRLPENRGLGAALNIALDQAQGELIAYLPSDDLYYPEHLALLAATLDQHPEAMLACSGLIHHYNRKSAGRICGHPLQLVQCMHRRTDQRWMERGELVSDDLDRLFWHRLLEDGPLVGSGHVSCEWVDHPAQGHKLIREPEGGINAYRQRYRVKEPLRFHSSVGNLIDEVGQYQGLRDACPPPPSFDRLKILLVGELAYNADRIVALEEQGHKLYGLWMRDPYWYNTVGPLPFGHVEDLDAEHWVDSVRQIQPDVIYALLNWQAVPFAREVMRLNPGIPFVWHFKEGPFICMEKGSWPQLVELYDGADGLIWPSPEMRDWFALDGIPGNGDLVPQLVLDGDLPRAGWFEGATSPRLSQQDGQIHTVVPGRPIGLHPQDVGELAGHGIHLHFYGDFSHGQWREWIDKASSFAPDHLHLHGHVSQERWLAEFSRYDAGWLHCFRSENGGDLRRANWDDLNYPARIGTFAVAGLPMIQRDNPDARVAAQKLVAEFEIGLFYSDFADLAAQLHDEERMQRLRTNLWQKRLHFSFDHHVGRLVGLLREAIRFRRERQAKPFALERDSQL